MSFNNEEVSLEEMILSKFSSPIESRFTEFFKELKKIESTNLNEQCKINMDDIQNGKDKRTTILLKNFPKFNNKNELLKYFSEIGNISFIYILKLSNKKKQPYIFLNVVNYKSIVQIINKSIIDFPNDNIQIVYSTIQGKKSLIAHFLQEKKEKKIKKFVTIN